MSERIRRINNSPANNSPDRNGVPMYDLKVVERLMKEGFTYKEALRIASSEMIGANEERDGRIHATQTNCDALGYDEDLPPDSIGRKEGENNTLKAIAETYGLESLNDSEAEALTDAILKKGGDLTPEEAQEVLEKIRKIRKKVRI